MRPDLRQLLATTEIVDEDSTAWLVTFSDLCLQLFAFVLVALIVTSARPRMMVPTPASAPAPARVELPAAPAPSEDRPVVEARETVPEPPPETPSARTADAPGELPAADAPVETAPEAEAAPPAPLAAVGHRLEDLFATAGIETVTVTTTSAAVIVSLPDVVTFPSGKADLLPAALPVLDRMRPTLQALPEYTVDVIGHTDDVPIRTALFPSNLELSLARAARVAGTLAASDPALRVRTRAAGFGEYRPLAPNDDDAGRARNRRVEIRLVPREAED